MIKTEKAAFASMSWFIDRRSLWYHGSKIDLNLEKDFIKIYLLRKESDNQTDSESPLHPAERGLSDSTVDDPFLVRRRSFCG
jgi:hypothetical protein